ncbi:hypothetical protein ACSZOD_21635 [Aeromonas hydrophila]
MDKLKDYLSDPWQQSSLHKAYKNSFLYLTPSPEVTTGEILLASLYRNVGFVGNKAVGEKVWELGTPFKKQLATGKRPDNAQSKVAFDVNLWKTVINRVIATPNLSGQSRQRGNQIAPLVPDATLYSMSARLKGNPWNPGKLVARMIALGSDNYSAALAIWQKLFHKLSVTLEEDDVWARILQLEFESWRVEKISDAWQMPSEFPLDEGSFPGPLNLDCPAKRFVEDLHVVLNLKQNLTRRQWISMLESLCRIGTAAHVTWCCHANHKCYELIEEALNLGQHYNEAEVAKKLSTGRGFWSLGQLTAKPIKEAARHYIEGRGALNLLLHMMEQVGFNMSQIRLGSTAEIATTLEYLAQHREKFSFDQYLAYFNQMIESDPQVSECKKGSSKNVLEFLDHVARKRIPSETELEGYDQGYYIEKRGNHRSSPWVVGLGPLSTLLMVHCAASRVTGPCTVQNLCEQLAGYGISAEMALGQGESLNKKLRDMSIAIDSPDAEGGMVIASPLAKADKEGN